MTYSPSFLEADSYQAAVGVKCGSLNFGALQQYVESLFDPIFFLFPVIVKVNLNIFGDLWPRRDLVSLQTRYVIRERHNG